MQILLLSLLLACADQINRDLVYTERCIDKKTYTSFKKLDGN